MQDQYSATATKNSEIGIQLSEADTYDFYGMYPAQNVKANSGSGNSLSATMPIYQTASTTEIMNGETNVGVGNLETSADMNSALMIAKEVGFKPNTQNNAKVNLQFEPFASMLNVTVNGVEQTNLQYKVLITSIIIEADAPIAGDFTYNYNAKNPEEAITFGENASNFIQIDTKFKDAAGHQIGVPMGPDSKLNVRAFMIPNPNVTSLKVKVVTSAAQTLTKTLNMKNFKNSQIHFAKLPKINASNLQFDYKIWLSQLDPNIYLSEISMPGSALTFSYKLGEDYQKTQTLDLTKQFENGIRVFQFHVNTVNQTSTYDGGSTSVGIALPGGSSMKVEDNSRYYTIEDVIDALHAEMKGLHKDEFCVVAISDWLANPVTTAKMTTLYNRLKAVLNKAGEKGLVATNVSPNTTIADVKGKVIFKVQLNGKFPEAWPELAGSDLWMNIFKNDANTNVFYSPMPFGELPATNAGGLNASNLTGPMNIIYSEVADPVEAKWDGYLLPLPYKYNPVYKDGVKDCATAVLAAYAKNYNSDEHKNFSMTYLGGQGIEYNNDGTKYYLPSQIAQDLNKIWLDYIRANTQNTTDELRTKPLGWVMLNCVGTEPTTSWCIEAVIRHNADPVFKHQRRSEKVRHSGDIQGTTNGGSIF